MHRPTRPPLGRHGVGDLPAPATGTAVGGVRPAARLDLQPPVDLVYQLGGYGRRLDYTVPPDPPLSADDAAWAAERVAASLAV
jgi:hypothetical protein